MGRRVLAFFLGMIFGIVVLLGTIAAGIYIAATVVSPSDIYPASDKFLGDLAHMTLYDIYKEISNLYKEKLGITGENGLYFTLGEFMERYHIDQIAAFGKPLPQDILEMPIFEFLGGSMENAMNQMRASVLLSFVNFMTQTTDEEGNLVGGYFGASAIEKLYLHAMSELTDAEKGMKYVFAEVMLTDMMPSFFPAEKPEEGEVIMWALGQTSIGRLFGGFQGGALLQFKTDGAFEAMGSLTVTQLMGKSSTYLNAIFGEKIFADLIDDEGNLIVDDLMNNLYLGALLGYSRIEIAQEDLEENYQELALETDDSIKVYKHNEEDSYAMSVEDVAYLAQLSCEEETHNHTVDECTDLDNPTCGKKEHAHSPDCFGFVWYDCADETEGHEHSDGCKKPEGMMAKIADERVKNLHDLSDTIKKFTLRDVLGEDVPRHLKSLQDTPIGEISAAIDNMYLGDFLEYQRKEVNETDYTIDVLTIDNQVLVKCNENGFAKFDGDKWYAARINCKDSAHGINHEEDCYDFMWYTSELNCVSDEENHAHTDECYVLTEVEGMMGKLACEKVINLSNINKTIKTFTLKDVMGEDMPSSLKSIENTPVGQLGTAIDNMYLGEFLQYVKKPVNDISGFVTVDGITDVIQKGEMIVKKEGDIWYEAVFNCTEPDHTHTDECYTGDELTCTVHTHSYDCYDYRWYDLNCTDPDNPDHEHGDDCYTPADGLIGRISRLKMSELNGNHIKNTVNETPLGEVLELSNANGLLKELSDVKIGNLSNELDALYVGVAMGYDRIQVTTFEGEFIKEYSDENKYHTDGNKILEYRYFDSEKSEVTVKYYFFDALRGKYYVAKRICAGSHEDDEDFENGEHKFTCFGYLWLDCDADFDAQGNRIEHEHTEACKAAKGLNAKIANLRIDELTGGRMTRIATSLTISDLVESEMMELTDDNVRTLNYIFSNKEDSNWRDMPLKIFMKELLDAFSSMVVIP